MQKNDCKEIVEAVQKAVAQAARRERSIWKQQQRLVDDILVLILGLRPAFLIDYVRVRVQTLQEILQHLDSAIQLFDPGRISLQWLLVAGFALAYSARTFVCPWDHTCAWQEEQLYQMNAWIRECSESLVDATDWLLH